MYLSIYLSIYLCMCVYIYIYILYTLFQELEKMLDEHGEVSSTSNHHIMCTRAHSSYLERFPDHRHRNLKAFREHIQKMTSSCFITERYLYNFSWLGVRVVWNLFISVSDGHACNGYYTVWGSTTRVPLT